MFLDTHAHLDDPAFHADLDAVLLRASDAGVERILAVGTDVESSRRAVALAQQYTTVFAAVGIHPHEADHYDEQQEAIRSLLHEDKVVAIGEIGLDYVRERAPRTAQLHAFHEQLRWAEDLRLPVSVHNRGADDDVLNAVQEHDVRVVLHCFSSSPEFARRSLSAGCYLSFAGNLTFPKSESIRDAARQVPLDRLLIESDAPVLAPQPWRGRRNEPAHVVRTAEVSAELQNVSLESLKEHLQNSADHLFGWRDA